MWHNGIILGQEEINAGDMDFILFQFIMFVQYVDYDF